MGKGYLQAFSMQNDCPDALYLSVAVSFDIAAGPPESSGGPAAVSRIFVRKRDEKTELYSMTGHEKDRCICMTIYQKSGWSDDVYLPKKPGIDSINPAGR